VTRPNKATCEFTTNCVHSDGDDIRDMKDAAVETTRRTFMSYLAPDQWRQIQLDLGYDPTGHELSLAKDWHVSYHRSLYRGEPCVYLVWSGIEYVFTERKT
jgi:hypothetical protein